MGCCTYGLQVGHFGVFVDRVGLGSSEIVAQQLLQQLFGGDVLDLLPIEVGGVYITSDRYWGYRFISCCTLGSRGCAAPILGTSAL